MEANRTVKPLILMLKMELLMIPICLIFTKKHGRIKMLVWIIGRVLLLQALEERFTFMAALVIRITRMAT